MGELDEELREDLLEAPKYVARSLLTRFFRIVPHQFLQWNRALICHIAALVELSALLPDVLLTIALVIVETLLPIKERK